MTAPMKPDQAGEDARTQQIARLTNDHLLKMQNEAQALYSEISNSRFGASLADVQYQEREALNRQVKEFKAALDQEYGLRVLRGYRSRFEKLVQALQPPLQEGGRRLIPINAAAAAQENQEDQAQQQDALLQTATALAEQLRAALAVFNGITIAAVDGAEETQGGGAEQ